MGAIRRTQFHSARWLISASLIQMAPPSPRWRCGIRFVKPNNRPYRYLNTLIKGVPQIGQKYILTHYLSSNGGVPGFEDMKFSYEHPFATCSSKVSAKE